MTASVVAQRPGDTNEEITVTGSRESVSRTLKQVLTESRYGQLGRFEERVCPGVAGLSLEYAATVVGLIRANAEEAGARLAEEGCRPNAIAVFVPQPAELIRGWRGRDPTLFGEMTESEIAALADRSGPVISWRVSDTVRYDGAPLERLESFDSGQGPQPVSRGALVVRGALASRHQQSVRQDIRLSIALIDAGAIRGRTLQQLADIATLHLFLDLTPDAAERAGPNSMLSLFNPRPEGAAAPARLSVLDRGMLAGLYRQTTNNFDGHQQRGRIYREIRREADAGE